MLSGLEKPKLFGLEEANRTLPLVSRVAKDIVKVHNEIQALQKEIRALRASGGTGSGGSSESAGEDAENLSLRLRAKVRELEEFLAELKQIGCECKDLRLGLIDFPAQLEDRVVLLCWKPDEPQIMFWHERDGGFAGRQSVKGCFPVGKDVQQN